MRFYAVKISGAPPQAFPPIPGALIPGAQFCSVVMGPNGQYQNDPCALRLTIHAQIIAVHTGSPGDFVRLWGVSLDMINQASDLTGMYVEVYGGFWPGLPLATYESVFSGLLMSGSVIGVFGNWRGLDMTLDLYLSSGADQKSQSQEGGSFGAGAPSPGMPATPTQRLVARNAKIGRQRPRVAVPGQLDGDPLSGALGDLSSIVSTLAGVFGAGGWLSSPLNLIHSMMPGMPLDTVMQQTLQAAFKNAIIKILVKGGLTMSYHDAGFYQSLSQWAGYMKLLSQNIGNGQGVGGAIGGALSSLGGAIGGQIGGDISQVGGLVSQVSGLIGGAGGGSSYPGASTYAYRNTVLVTDFTIPNGTMSIAPWELIGQPTWGGKDDEDKAMANFLVPMRSDIAPGSVVILPDTLVYEVPSFTGSGVIGALGGSGSLAQRGIAFSGPCTIKQVQIVGDSRHPDGASWALSLWGVPQGGGPPVGAASGLGPGSGGMAPIVAPQRLVARNAMIRKGSR